MLERLFAAAGSKIATACGSRKNWVAALSDEREEEVPATFTLPNRMVPLRSVGSRKLDQTYSARYLP
jgi:hypothetical protein